MNNVSPKTLLIKQTNEKRFALLELLTEPKKQAITNPMFLCALIEHRCDVTVPHSTSFAALVISSPLRPSTDD